MKQYFVTVVFKIFFFLNLGVLNLVEINNIRHIKLDTKIWIIVECSQALIGSCHYSFLGYNNLNLHFQ